MSTYTDLLRAVAGLIDEHELVECHVNGTSWITIHTDTTMDDPKHEAAKWRRALGGTWSKRDQNEVIVLSLASSSLPGAPSVDIFLGKEACVRRVVGVEDVVVPAVEAQPERVEQRELVEWDCEPVLAVAL